MAPILNRFADLSPSGQIAALVLVVLLVALARFAAASIRRRFFSHRARRHRRFQAQARAVLGKLASIEHAAQRLAYLRKIPPLVFEEVLLEAFELRGCPIERNDRYTGDGGIDGKVHIGREWYFVQAKRYGTHINRAHVDEFIDIVERTGCKGIFIHTGRTGEASRTLARQSAHVSIISGDKLLGLLDVSRPWQFQPK